jgi:hypothetical protein
MSVALTLTAPPDLSVGRIRLTSSEHEIGGWIASPTEMQHRFETLEAGVYQAVAEPLGQQSRSFFFLLNEEDKQVDMPTLQAMSSPSFAVSNLQAVAGTILRSVMESAAASVQDVVQPALRAIVESSKARPIALGLSSYLDFESGSTHPYVSGPTPEITVSDGAVELVLNRPENGLTPGAFKLVLTCAVGGGRNLLGRVPLFKGGVRITLSASPLGAADLTCRVQPVNRNRRAITQALFAGSSTEAAPVFKTIPGGREELIGREDWREDPWTSVAACLLCFRFPDLAPDGLPIDLLALATCYPALPDAHVLLARERLRQVAKTAATARERSDALNDALTHMQQSGDAGPPYFAYTAQLAQEALLALATDGELKARATAQLARLSRYALAPRNAGASHVWWSADIPARSGTLDTRSATVAFSGWVNQDGIALNAQRTPSLSTALAQVASPVLAAAARFVPRLQSIAPDSLNESWGDALAGLSDLRASALSLLGGETSNRPEAPASPPVAQTTIDPPALKLPVAEADDPHKGRFGGNDSVGGFTLAAGFADGEDAKLVRISLSVSGERGFESYDEVVEFFVRVR